MKKLLSFLALVLLLTGCSITNMDNTPTKNVEDYLNNYQTLDTDVLEKLDTIVDREVTFSENQKKGYRDILKKHYQDLVYKIKEETVNGDRATVETEIEVNDYSKTLRNVEQYRLANESSFNDENGVFDESKFNDYKIEALKNNKDKVKYTIYFSLTKMDNKWNLDTLTDTEQEKLLGIYQY